MDNITPQHESEPITVSAKSRNSLVSECLTEGDCLIQI